MITQISKVKPGHELTNKPLIAQELWEFLAARIARAESIEYSLAERVLDQVFAFLMLRIHEPAAAYSPSRLVDSGWRIFIEDAPWAYWKFCWRMDQDILRDESVIDYSPESVARTLDALKAQRIIVDESIWTA